VMTLDPHLKTCLQTASLTWTWTLSNPSPF
jgi:hypothetical protein